MMGIEEVNSSVRSGRVLIADRHLSLLGGMHRLLAGRFESVLMVADEHSLVDALELFAPDLAVVDFSWPSESGFNLARRLLKTRPGLRLIVLSAHDEPAIVGPLLNAGALGFVLKRRAATELLPAIEAVLAGGRFVGRSVPADRSTTSDRSPDWN